jgi:hypothetical protein
MEGDFSASAKHARSHSGNRDDYSSHHGAGGNSDDSGDEEDDAGVLAPTRMEEFLDLDPRPTFIVDKTANFNNGLEPAFSNTALKSNPQLTKALAIKTSLNPSSGSPKVSSAEFRAWLNEVSQLQDIEASIGPSFPFWGFSWTAFVIRKRWMVVSGAQNGDMKGVSNPLPLRSASPTSLAGQAIERQRKKSSPPGFQDSKISVASPDPFVQNSLYSFSTPDWTIPQPESDLSSHIIFARSIDWSATPLGDMSKRISSYLKSFMIFS